MAYHLRCSCGIVHQVSGADAGVSFPCSCGMTVVVPTLNELRASDARRVLSPLERVRRLLITGQLPGLITCSCIQASSLVLHVEIVCYREPIHGGTSTGENMANLLFGWLIALAIRRRREKYGDEVSVVVPIPVCNDCRERLNGDDLEDAVRRIPAYAEILDFYPHAEIRRRG
jgi:hypothetical protein